MAKIAFHLHFPVASEIQVLANMILVFLYSRYGDTGDKIDSNPIQYSIPVPAFPVAASGNQANDVDDGDAYVEAPIPSEGHEYSSDNNKRNSKPISRDDDSESSGSSEFAPPDRSYSFNADESTVPRSLRDDFVRKRPTENQQRSGAKLPRYLSGTATSSKRNVSGASPGHKGAGSPDGRSASPAWGAGAGKSKGGDKKDFKYYAYKSTNVI
jgi:hypothetical protein